MRLKKGTKVEVLTKKEVPSGSWHCAEIIGCNGHSYTVRYDDDIGSFGVVERVSRKVIRPCPPSVDVLEDWIPGDVVEVFHNLSWKMATVLKVSGRSYILVRLLGSSIEFKANQVDVRARLCWQDGEWVVIGKAFGKHEDMRFRLPSSRKYNDPALKLDTSASQRIKVDHVSARNINSVLDSQDIPSRTLKRKPSLCYREFEAYAGRKQKVRLGEKHSTCYPFSVQQPQLPEKEIIMCAFALSPDDLRCFGICCCDCCVVDWLYLFFKVHLTRCNADLVAWQCEQFHLHMHTHKGKKKNKKKSKVFIDTSPCISRATVGGLYTSLLNGYR